MTAALDLCLALGLLAMVGLASVNVALRYIWDTTILWADESLIFSMIGLAFIGVIGVSHRDGHLRMSLVSQMAGARLRRAFGVVEQLATAAVCLFVAYHGWTAVARLYGRGTKSNMAEVPLWFVNGLVLVGLIGMALIAFMRLFILLRGTDGEARS